MINMTSIQYTKINNIILMIIISMFDMVFNYGEDTERPEDKDKIFSYAL